MTTHNTGRHGRSAAAVRLRSRGHHEGQGYMLTRRHKGQSAKQRSGGSNKKVKVVTLWSRGQHQGQKCKLKKVTSTNNTYVTTATLSLGVNTCHSCYSTVKDSTQVLQQQHYSLEASGNNTSVPAVTLATQCLTTATLGSRTSRNDPHK